MASLVSDSAPAPTTKLLLRGKEGVHLLNGPRGEKGLDDDASKASVVDDPSVPTEMSNLVEFSPDGQWLARTNGQGVEVVHTNGGEPAKLITDVSAGRVQKLAWSPHSSFLVTWHKPEAASGSAESGEEKEGSLRVFALATCARVATFHLKMLSQMTWPALQWTSDESYCMRLVTNAIEVFEGRSLEKGFIGKISAPGLVSMAVSPSHLLPVKMAAFTPESKGRPASVRVHQFPQVANATTASKTFYNAQECVLDWAPNGSAVLVKTSTDVDKSGASYYGSTGLYLLHADGQYEASVPLPKEGPVSDAKWSPTSRHFVVIAGTMPAVATLFDLNAKPVFSFGSAHRSVVSFAPHGRFLCLAGFGNLAGDMDFWDVNKQKRLGTANSHCAVAYGWSPCSRFFMTATCAPRMNVDNCVKLFRYTGSLLVKLPHDQLFDAKWRPAPKDAFTDRPHSPERVLPANGGGGKGGGGKGGNGGGGAAPVTKVAAYRPPGSNGSLAAMMRAEREGGIGASSAGKPLGLGGGMRGSAASGGKTLPVGMAPPKESNTAKNKAKKDAKAKAKAAAAEAAAEMERLRIASGGAPAAVAASPESLTSTAEASAAVEAAAPEPVDPAKQLKKQMKALKAIETLLVKQAAGEALNSDQRNKLATEAAVRADIAALEAAIKAQ